jgi:ABC-type Mn2+/Zn2+ transport system permease subunit
MSEQITFLGSFPLWRDPVLVAVLCSAALSSLGIWMVLRKTSFIPLALSQISSLGIIAAFFAEELLVRNICPDCGGVLPVASTAAFLFALIAALYFARPESRAADSIAATYLLSSAALLLLGNYVRRDIHDVQSILYGSAVLADKATLILSLLTATGTALVQILYFKRFTITGFDPDSAGALGINVYFTEAVLYATTALVISIATRALGALPAFGLMVLPALTGLRIAGSMRHAILASMAAAVTAAAVGYYASFTLDLPAGASMTAVAGIIYVTTTGIRLLRGKI